MKKFICVLSLFVSFTMMLSMNAFAINEVNISKTNGTTSTRDFEIIYDEYYTFSSYYTIIFDIKTSGYYNVWLLSQEKTSTNQPFDFKIMEQNDQKTNIPIQETNISSTTYRQWNSVYFSAGRYCARYISSNANAVYYGNLYVHKS